MKERDEASGGVSDSQEERKRLRQTTRTRMETQTHRRKTRGKLASSAMKKNTLQMNVHNESKQQQSKTKMLRELLTLRGRQARL